MINNLSQQAWQVILELQDVICLGDDQFVTVMAVSSGLYYIITWLYVENELTVIPLTDSQIIESQEEIKELSGMNYLVTNCDDVGYRVLYSLITYEGIKLELLKQEDQLISPATIIYK